MTIDYGLVFLVAIGVAVGLGSLMVAVQVFDAIERAWMRRHRASERSNTMTTPPVTVSEPVKDERPERLVTRIWTVTNLICTRYNVAVEYGIVTDEEYWTGTPGAPHA